MKRYEQLDVVVNCLPKNWIPNTVLLEGMFIIQTPPVSTTSTFNEYAEFITKRYLMPHLKANTSEVHVLFDDPDQMPESPKQLERKRRDESHTVQQHQCNNISDTVNVPSSWHDNLLNCRICKRSLCEYLSYVL